MTVLLWISFAICLVGTLSNLKSYVKNRNVFRKELKTAYWLTFPLNVFVTVVLMLVALGVGV